MRLSLRFATFMVLATGAAMALLPIPAQAGDHDTDYKAVRQAVESGEIRSLTDILAAIRTKLPGDVVGVEVEHKHGHWHYEFRVADKQGRLFEVYVNARTAAIERIKEK